MKHYRVIPRDFFNEAKLLKCLGMLVISIGEGKLPDGINIVFDEPGTPFKIELDSGFNVLHVANYPITVNDEPVMFGTTYNSKSAYPLYAIVDNCEYEVFDEAGEFTDEFIEQFTKN